MKRRETLDGEGAPVAPLQLRYESGGRARHAARRSVVARFIPLALGHRAQAHEAVEVLPPRSGAELTPRLRRNEVVPIANGYSFVPDYRPAGHEDDHIPNTDYTMYFMNGWVPYASSGRHRNHDIEKHGPSYLELFRHETFASIARDAATASFYNEHCYDFTDAMDNLGGAHILLTQYVDPPEKQYDYLQQAKRHMQRLIRLRDGDTRPSLQPLAGQDLLAFSNLWIDLGFERMESELESALKPDFVSSYAL